MGRSDRKLRALAYGPRFGRQERTMRERSAVARTHLRCRSVIRSRCHDRLVVVIQQDSLCGSIEVIVLAALERPHERREPGEAKTERDGNEVEEICHWAPPRTGYSAPLLPPDKPRRCRRRS